MTEMTEERLILIEQNWGSPQLPECELIAEIRRLHTDASAKQDHIDLMLDEFERIKSILHGSDAPEASEIKQLCERAVTNTIQRHSVIKQRNQAQEEVARLRALLSTGLLLPAVDLSGEIEEGRYLVLTSWLEWDIYEYPNCKTTLAFVKSRKAYGPIKWKE